MSCEVVITRGGARAILDHATMEVMHPIVGPLVEPARLYIAPSRLVERLADGGDPLVIFDVGLGAAGVAIAAWHASAALPATARQLEIVSFDRDRAALALALEHGADFGLDGEAGVAAHALLSRGQHETTRTRWRFVEGELPATLEREPAASADVVYWDAFSPKRNAELWSAAAFRALHRCCRAGCAVLTYSGATATRSALLLGGFAVGVGVPVGEEKLSTHAALSAAELERPLDARWLDRVSRSSAPFPADAPADALAQLASAPQFMRR